uniref:(northern house mosquito) hypothetical protein n=1 Tax=Culex pipiens TaxID=7175 RepID=A0A8D8BBA5_CULPI
MARRQGPSTVLLRHAQFTDHRHTHHLQPTDLHHVQFMAHLPQLRLQFMDLLHDQLLHHRHLTDLPLTTHLHQSTTPRHLLHRTDLQPRPTTHLLRSSSKLQCSSPLPPSNPLLLDQSTKLPRSFRPTHHHHHLNTITNPNPIRSTAHPSSRLRCSTPQPPHPLPSPPRNTDHPSSTSITTSSRW